MNDGIESQAISPGLGEVPYFHSWVLVGRLLGPSQQRLLRSEILLTNNNIRDLKQKKTVRYTSDSKAGCIFHGENENNKMIQSELYWGYISSIMLN